MLPIHFFSIQVFQTSKTTVHARPIPTKRIWIMIILAMFVTIVPGFAIRRRRTQTRTMLETLATVTSIGTSESILHE